MKYNSLFLFFFNHWQALRDHMLLRTLDEVFKCSYPEIENAKHAIDDFSLFNFI